MRVSTAETPSSPYWLSAGNDGMAEEMETPNVGT